ncbi:hypothetical protein [Burkholderia sp. LMU1-1-1.1]|uniref:hypothetical protein n=1 Tax=Burkholderia sp. LMU1-1-1.1 TaxID=3135266 RepID=UPI00343676C0
MKARTNTEATGQSAALVSVLPAPRIMRTGGVDLSAVEQQLIKDFRQMRDGSRSVMVRFFEKQASRDREQRIAENKPKFQLVAGGVR